MKSLINFIRSNDDISLKKLSDEELLEYIRSFKNRVLLLADRKGITVFGLWGDKGEIAHVKEFIIRRDIRGVKAVKAAVLFFKLKYPKYKFLMWERIPKGSRRKRIVNINLLLRRKQ